MFCRGCLNRDSLCFFWDCVILDIKLIEMKYKISLQSLFLVLLLSVNAFGQSYLHYENTGGSHPACYLDLIMAGEECHGFLTRAGHPPVFLSGKTAVQGTTLLTSPDGAQTFEFKIVKKRITNPVFKHQDEIIGLPEMQETWNRGNIPFKVLQKSAVQKLFEMKNAPAATVSLLFPDPQWGSSAVVNHQLRKILFYLYFGREDLSESIVSQAIDTEIQRFMEGYLAQNQEYYQKEMPAASFSWEKNLQFDVVCNTKQVLSLRVRSYVFSGGAHGMEVKKTLNYNLQQEEVINLQEIIPMYHYSALSALIKQKLALRYGTDADASLTGLGFFKDDISPSENFYITPNGIGFIYNPYEIGPFDMGAPEVFIPASEFNAWVEVTSYWKGWFQSR